MTEQLGQPVMMQLGEFQFGIATAAFQELARTNSWRFPTQELFGKMPTAQFTGPGEDVMTLPGVIYPEWRGGLGVIPQLRALAETGEPQTLVDGSGVGMGRWFIEGLEETQTVFGAGGKPRRIDFSLSLRKYEAATDADLAAGIAALSVALPIEVPAEAVTTVEKTRGLAGSVSAAAKSLSATLERVSEQVQEQIAPYADIARDSMGAVSRSLGIVTELQGLANHTLGALGVKPVQVTALLGAENLAARAASALVRAESASAVLRTSSEKLGRIADVPTSASGTLQAAQAAADRTVTFARATAQQAGTIGE